MAVIQAQSGGGIGGLLGGLATIGGALTGQPWLTALGTGLGMMSGGGAGAGGGNGYASLGEGVKGLLDQLSGWVNPASGSMVDPAKKAKEIANKVINPAQINNNWQQALMLQNQNPYNRGVNNLWGLY